MRLTEAEAVRMGIPVPPKVKNKGRERQRNGKSKRTKYSGDPLFDRLCLLHGLPVPVHQYDGWHPERKYAFDYLFNGYVAVEKVGGVWIRGHHSRGQSQIDDMARRNDAQILGYIVLEFTPQQFDDGSAFAVIKRALASEGEQP